MRPRERRETSEQELFRSRLDQIIDMKHALVKLGQAIDWRFLEERFGAVYTDKPGQPPLPTRLMAGLAILKHTYDLSDEALCDRWVESPYFQYFCGEEFFQHTLVFDRSSLRRWRQRMGENKLKTLLQESLAVATRTDAMKPSDLARVVIDTTVSSQHGHRRRMPARSARIRAACWTDEGAECPGSASRFLRAAGRPLRSTSAAVMTRACSVLRQPPLFIGANDADKRAARCGS